MVAQAYAARIMAKDSKSKKKKRLDGSKVAIMAGPHELRSKVTSDLTAGLAQKTKGPKRCSSEMKEEARKRRTTAAAAAMEGVFSRRKKKKKKESSSEASFAAILRDEPEKVFCPGCGNHVITETYDVYDKYAYLTCFGLATMG